MKSKILLAGLACLSVVAVGQQSNTSDQKTKPNPVMVRESPSKASLGRRESPSKSSNGVVAGDVNGDGKADKAAIGSQSSGTGAGVAINNSHSNIKSPRDLATGQASGKTRPRDTVVTNGPTPASTDKK